MDEDSNEFAKSCYKFNRTLSNREEICDLNLRNLCFSVWELIGIEKYIDKVNPYLNLTQFKEVSTISLKGCWSNHYLENNNCSFTNKPKPTFICYCKGTNCNKNDLPNLDLLEKAKFSLNDTGPSDLPDATSQNHLIIYLFPIAILIALIFILLYKQRNKLSEKLNFMKQGNFNGKKSIPCIIEIKEPLLSNSTPKIIEQLKQGQFCSVYKGKIDHLISTEQLNLVHPGQDTEQMVAIKAYPQQMYDSFKHEHDVYIIPQLKHKNILKFISAEEKQISSGKLEYWIVLEYHENGSLYDYLKLNLLTYPQLLEISLNIAMGLSYLHNNKSCIVVHRDIKSKNILLRNDLTAVISDFNLALLLYPNQPAFENLDQVGTIRYMSPEVLDCAIQFSKEALMKIDIYSTSLVFWELMSRCSAIGLIEPYLMPYEKELGTFLFKEQLRKHVSENKQRPEIPEHWCVHHDLREFAKTINDSWDHDSDARLTASGIVERLKWIKMRNDVFRSK